MIRSAFWLILLLLCATLAIPALLTAQTTGKIAGTVKDAASGQPLPGAVVVIEGSKLGAAADIEGSFFILNLSPGVYTLQIRMVGYESMSIRQVRVSVNRTSEITARLKATVIKGQEVIVTADAIEVKKDQTSSVRNVSADKIEKLPVESLSAVINMQAGVVAGHFRGGRSTEVSYLIDGVQVDEGFSGSGRAVSLEAEAIADLEVITGTFNAEYGRAMSGVVNAVTKEGGNQFHGSFSSSLANYLTPHDDIFIGLNSGRPGLNLSQDYKFQLEGPFFRDKLSFFINGRYQDQNGYLNGIRRFNPWDYSDYSAEDPAEWHIEHTGDNKYVSMDHSQNLSLMTKLAWNATSRIKVTGLYTLNDDMGQGYSHGYKYNPDARGFSFHTAHMGALQLNHMLSQKFFYEVKLSHVDNRYKSYRYENPLDSRFLHGKYYGSGHSGFATGGIDGPGRSMSFYKDSNLKLDATWQATKHHAFKAGLHGIYHDIDQDRIDVRNKWSGTAEENLPVTDANGKITFPYYELEIVPHTPKTMGIYKKQPYEFSGYLQDKLEYNEMVVNIGLRYDYFNPDQVYPTNRRNPSNQLNLPDSMLTSYKRAEPQTQLSPRLGLAYQLSDQAVLHFSYGHFFQMPPMYALYENNIFRVPVGDYGTTMGNAQLNAQKTISYEIGVWQELTKGMGLELALFYKDIYDLLSTMVITTYNQIEYGLYTNKDYGNARGLEVKYDFTMGRLSANLNYTLQYTKGNADNPQQTFTRAGSSMDPIRRLIPMSWDQRHTFNATVNYSGPHYGATLTGYYNSGTPYSFSPMTESPLSLINLYQNNDYKPAGYTLDMTSYYDITVWGKQKVRLTLSVYNLLDRLNANWVYSDTGQPYTTIVREAQLATHRSDFNDYYDRVKNPTAYSSPRQVKLGIGFVF